jgi:hypothetical protein
MLAGAILQAPLEGKACAERGSDPICEVCQVKVCMLKGSGWVPPPTLKGQIGQQDPALSFSKKLKYFLLAANISIV